MPELSVDSIGLTVSSVRAKVSLDANAMNLVQISAGVDVGIKQVQLGIVGVYGEVYLYADLDSDPGPSGGRYHGELGAAETLSVGRRA